MLSKSPLNNAFYDWQQSCQKSLSMLTTSYNRNRHDSLFFNMTIIPCATVLLSSIQTNQPLAFKSR
jgi:hypothetical protein